MMTIKRPTFSGGVSNTDGACPGCGAAVERRHAWSTGRANDVYDCETCGTFQYGTDIEIDAQPEPGRPSSASQGVLATLLGPDDVVA